uniref:Uncharacterized protein n=1 Tax=Sphaerodactylus townsendi TaxID=933632 RepID=A0ACB8G3T5_9SAUR
MHEFTVLQGEWIEKDHCIVENQRGVVTLQPLQGAHCLVNGHKVTDSFRLSQGALVVLGKAHKFRFNHPAEAAILRQRRSRLAYDTVEQSKRDKEDTVFSPKEVCDLEGNFQLEVSESLGATSEERLHLDTLSPSRHWRNINLDKSNLTIVTASIHLGVRIGTSLRIVFLPEESVMGKASVGKASHVAHAVPVATSSDEHLQMSLEVHSSTSTPKTIFLMVAELEIPETRNIVSPTAAADCIPLHYLRRVRKKSFKRELFHVTVVLYGSGASELNFVSGPVQLAQAGPVLLLCYADDVV